MITPVGPQCIYHFPVFTYGQAYVLAAIVALDTVVCELTAGLIVHLITM